MPMEESFLLGAPRGSSGVKPTPTVCVSRAGGGGGLLTRALGTGTGTRGTRGAGALAKLPVLELAALSDELLRPDWLLASLRRSRYVSCADSVLLCTVTEMKGLEAERGGTGGGVLL